MPSVLSSLDAGFVGGDACLAAEAPQVAAELIRECAGGGVELAFELGAELAANDQLEAHAHRGGEGNDQREHRDQQAASEAHQGDFGGSAPGPPEFESSVVG